MGDWQDLDWNTQLTPTGIHKVFGGPRSPYYIWAPRWVEASAGIRSLHYLCHSLNSQGERAFLVMTEPRHLNEPRVNPMLFTPPLTQDVVDAGHSANIEPIAVYSETVSGNPLGANKIVRLLMNYSGALGGPEIFDANEMIFAFSEKIALDYQRKTGSKPPVLFIPPIDPREFEFSLKKLPYQVVYAGKYRSFVGKPPIVGRLPSVEIFRDGPNKQRREHVKKLLSEASVVYSFENSSIVTEAILSGTPAGFIPNEFLKDVIAEYELGWGGTFLGDSERGLSKARATVSSGREAYLVQVSNFMGALKYFVKQTQGLPRKSSLPSKVRIPNVNNVITLGRFSIALQILRHQGPLVLTREFAKFVISNLPKR